MTDPQIIHATGELLRLVLSAADDDDRLAAAVLPLGVRAELDAAALAFSRVRDAIEEEDAATAGRLVARAFGALAAAARIAAHDARQLADARARRRRRR